MKEGIYFDLPEEEYFAAKALSNSSMKDLHISPLQFWDKHINPDQPEEKQSDAKDYGKAFHKMILEPEVFDDFYTHKINLEDFEGALDTMDDMRDFCRERGIKPSNTKTKTIERIREAMGDASPLFIDELKQQHDIDAGDRHQLSISDWGNIQKAGEIAYQDEYFTSLMEGGHSEVSIIVEYEGIMLKCRIDRLTMRATLDLKTFSQLRKVPVKRTILDALYYEGYFIQARFYQLVREIAREKLERGAIEVHGAPEGWIEEFIAAKDHTFGLIFIESSRPFHMAIYAVRDIIPQFRDVNLYWQIATTRIREMMNLYNHYTEKFGDKPWRESAKPETLSDHDIPQIMYS